MKGCDSLKEIEKLTSKSILEESIFIELFEIEDEIKKARRLLALTDRAEELGVKTKFIKLYRAYQKVQKEVNQKKTKPSSFDNYTEFGYGESEFYCGNWIADQTGIRTFTMQGERLACYHPILPVMRLINAETGKEKIKLAFKKGWNWKELIVEKEVIASHTKILSLASLGVSVTSENARALVQFLADIENRNLNQIAVQISTSKLGWVNGEFMPYGEHILFDSETNFKDIFESVRECGEERIWMELIKSIRKSGRIEPRLYLAASFASVLLKPFHALPFICNLYGETGKGKTVALMVATSIWANPAENKYMTDPTSTPISLEIRQDILNHLPLVIDDLSKTREKYLDNFTDIIYQLCGGKGKDRSNVNLGLNKATTWCNAILTNMERPLATDTMRGGAINRILDFEMEEGAIFPDGNYVVETISHHYGFAGKLFIEALEQIGWEELHKKQHDYFDKIQKRAAELGVEKEEKQVMPFSIMLVADEIATDYLFQDGIYLDFQKCVDCLKNKGEVSENERAYEFILGEVAVNINKFKPDENGEYKGEMWGCIEKGYVIILNNAFHKICERGNFSNKAFLSWAAKKKLILQDGEGKNTKLKKINGSPVRCVFLKMPEEKSEFCIVENEEAKQIGFIFS